MPKARTSGMQHNADSHHYGSIPVSMFPDGDPDGGEIQVPVWVSSESAWYMLTMIGGGGTDINVSLSEGTLEIFISDNRVYGSFDSDAIVKAPVPFTYTGNAVLKGTLSATFTADAALV